MVSSQPVVPLVVVVSGTESLTDRCREACDRCGVLAVPCDVRSAREIARRWRPLALVFLATFVLLNVMLHMMVIRRVTRLAAIADQVSLGNLDAGDFKSRSRDEIGVLSEALARMKVSLVQAMRMLE